jgi:hypothetical protein
MVQLLPAQPTLSAFRRPTQRRPYAATHPPQATVVQRIHQPRQRGVFFLRVHVEGDFILGMQGLADPNSAARFLPAGRQSHADGTGQDGIL